MKRSLLIGLAGLVSTFLIVGGPGLAQWASAQPTKTEIKQRGGEAAKKAATNWDSLTPEQQKQVQERMKEGGEKARTRWNSMTPEEQQQALARGKAAAEKGRKKWQSLPQ